MRFDVCFLVAILFGVAGCGEITSPLNPDSTITTIAPLDYHTSSSTQDSVQWINNVATVFEDGVEYTAIRHINQYDEVYKVDLYENGVFVSSILGDWQGGEVSGYTFTEHEGWVNMDIQFEYTSSGTSWTPPQPGGGPGGCDPTVICVNSSPDCSQHWNNFKESSITAVAAGLGGAAIIKYSAGSASLLGKALLVAAVKTSLEARTHHALYRNCMNQPA